MERFCTNCGNTLEEDALFCPECGTSVATEAPAISAQEPESDPSAFSSAIPKEEAPAPKPQTPGASMGFSAAAGAAAPKPVSSEPVVSAPIQPETPTANPKPLSTASYFWTLLLFGIPVLGLFAMLITAFTAKNSNRKNLAQACLIWLLILLILLGIFLLVLVVFGKSFGFDIRHFSLETMWEGFIRGLGFTK